VPIGLYISVPFCRSKCSYCNFASGVFSRSTFQGYVEHICANLRQVQTVAAEVGGRFENQADSIYLGGGTPTLLDIAGLERIFVTVSQNFEIATDAEITVECAPGTLNDSVIAALLRCGVNRVSLGVQSFVDQEARSVGRLHTRAVVLDDIARLRHAGISNINVDLIAGLPHQTMESWLASVNDAIHTDAPHVSVYMLEVDEDSRLGSELIAGGAKYHAHFVPDEDLTADLYEVACERLQTAGIEQYEISNFAKLGKQSQHNLKYWLRKPYLGLGVDAHSMLLSEEANARAVRFSMPDSLDGYMKASRMERTTVSANAFLQEAFFLGLRLNRGVDTQELRQEFGNAAVDEHSEAITELMGLKLLQAEGDRIFLTAKGRLLSNDVFQEFLSPGKVGERSR